MHTFHGSFIRKCIVTHVIDGKTIRVLLNPEGGQQRTQSGEGWMDSLVVGSAPGSSLPPEELDASSLDPKTWEKVDVRLIYVDTEEALQPKKEEAAYKVREICARDEKRRDETKRMTDPKTRARRRRLAAGHAVGARIVRLAEETSRCRARWSMRKRRDRFRIRYVRVYVHFARERVFNG